jgi:dihydrofolate reductase
MRLSCWAIAANHCIGLARVAMTYRRPSGLTCMTTVTSHISISLDGFAAGPNQSLENPLGEGGERLHEWAFATRGFRAAHGLEGGEDGPDSDLIPSLTAGVGAYVMGRRMFGGGPGAWDPEWRGWWGDVPPFHVPVFVLTHHAREPLEMGGGTTFEFVTGGPTEALQRARAAAGDGAVTVAGGAQTIQQFLRAGLLDELHLHVVPTVLGAGERLLENVGAPALEPVEVVASPAVTHVRYRVVH